MLSPYIANVSLLHKFIYKIIHVEMLTVEFLLNASKTELVKT